MFRCVLACLLIFLSTAHAAEVSSEALWQRLRAGGAIVLMRHAATTPGIGDPPGFELGKCATQRNLSDAGRRDARAIGAAFHSRGVNPGAVWASRWCRCLDTARLAFGQVQPEPTLDSMFNDDDTASKAKLRELRTKLAERRETSLLVLVTHDVNIRALSGQSLAPGEMVVTVPRDGRLAVLGRLDARAGRLLREMAHDRPAAHASAASRRTIADVQPQTYNRTLSRSGRPS